MRVWFLLLLGSFAIGCSGAPLGADGGLSDAGIDAGTASAQGSCKPTLGARGNALHVGAYCSPGGGECAQWGGSSFCAIDLDPRGGKFCLLIGCSAQADCGAEACCTGDPSNPIHACVPIDCLTDGGVCPAIPTADGGAPDSGPQDGGSPDA